MPIALEVVDRGAEADGAGDVRRARLEARRDAREGRLLEAHRRDHVAAAEERRHRLEQLARAPTARRCPTARTACGPRRRRSRSRARARRRAGAAPPARRRPAARRRARRTARAISLDRIHRAEHVRDVRDRDELRARREQRLEGVEAQLAAVVDRRHAQRAPRALAQQLPRHDVRVVLHLGDQRSRRRDRSCASPKLCATRLIASVALRTNTISRGSAAPMKRATFARASSQRARRAQRELVDAAVHVGVVAAVEAGDRVDHAARLLRAGGAVEEGERLAVHALLEDREVLADARRRRSSCRTSRVRRRSSLAATQVVERVGRAPATGSARSDLRREGAHQQVARGTAASSPRERR